MQYVFGKSFTRRFYPVIGGEAVSLPSQTPTIYIFEHDVIPTREVAAAGTGAIQTISAWTAQATPPYARSYTVTAIDDPHPTDSIYSRTYYETINFILAASEQTQTFIRSFEIERLQATEALPGTSIQDLVNIYPAIEKYLTRAELEEFIELAVDQCRLDLEGKGFDLYQMQKLDRLALPVAYKAIALASFSQMRQPGDRMDRRFEVFGEMYSSAMGQIELPHDHDRDGQATQMTKTPNAWTVVR